MPHPISNGQTAAASPTPLKVLVVGAGIGGLACAISCRKENIEVVILEKAAEISQIGAGIQVPPNACKTLRYFGLEQAIRDRGGVELQNMQLRRYDNGKKLCGRPGGERMIRDFGAPWYVIHRADYHGVLMVEALRLGADLRKDCEVVNVVFSESPHVVLLNGDKVYADVIVGADGLWSSFRDLILDQPSPPIETGDLAYRGTFSRKQLEAFNDPQINEMINAHSSYVWIGPNRHSVFYPVKGGTFFNLVLIRPDNLPPDARTMAGEIGEMRMTYEGWEPILAKIISCIPSVLKWKLCHHEELRTWVKGNVVLIGDASHPTLPYQAQGAAMAVEDGATLGILLGRLSHSEEISQSEKHVLINPLLHLFETLRKKRTTTIVKGAIQNRTFFHMPDGPEQIQRDKTLSAVDWKEPCAWQWADIGYQKEMLGFDVPNDTNRAFDAWVKNVGGAS